MGIQEIFEQVYGRLKADYYMFNGTIADDTADEFIKTVRKNYRREFECVLILTTYGGDPDAGYRIMRALRRYYRAITFYVFGSCKSTGTLMALGADQIVMSDFGEFGPLDIQLTKDDELQNTSSLNIIQSLNSLNQQMFSTFEENFLTLKRRSRHAITTKTAADICSKLSVGLFSPISAQIDPHKFGETQRAILIAEKYGKRLMTGPHLQETLVKLMVDYPSHGFVIDFDEAKKLFGDAVRWVNSEESMLEQILLNFVRGETGEDVIELLNDMLYEDEDEDEVILEDEDENEDEAILEDEDVNKDKITVENGDDETKNNDIITNHSANNNTFTEPKGKTAKPRKPQGKTSPKKITDFLKEERNGIPKQ